MEQIISILGKIEKIAENTAQCSAIEKDLMLRYTRDLYEAILSVECKAAEDVKVQQELAEEPEPSPIAVIGMEEEKVQVIEEELYNKEEEERVVQDESEQEYNEPGKPYRAEREEVQDSPDNSEQYSDISVRGGEEQTDLRISFELEPELREEIPVPPRFKSSTDFKIGNRDIRSYIGINDKYNFISELFRQNSEAYEEILTEINQCDSKQDALRFLENAGITTLYKWKEDGFSEQIFYNVISQFFAAR